MIALLLVASAFAADPGVPVAWDDALSDRAPREPTVAVTEGMAFGDTLLFDTRMQVGHPLYRRARFGLGFTIDQRFPAVAIPSEDRGSLALGGFKGTLQTWFSPAEHPGTYHAVVAEFGYPVASAWFHVHPQDSWVYLSLGYDGYWDFGDTVDVAFGFAGGLGVPQDAFASLVGRAHAEALVTPAALDQVAIVGGVTGSVGVVAVQVGARWRPAGPWEVGAAVAVPVITLASLGGEVPLWPVLDARARF